MGLLSPQSIVRRLQSVFEQHQVKKSAKWLCAELVRRHTLGDPGSAEVRASLRDLARTLDLAPNTVLAARAYLISRGLIAHSGSAGHVGTYTLLPPLLSPVGRAAPPISPEGRRVHPGRLAPPHSHLSPLDPIPNGSVLQDSRVSNLKHSDGSALKHADDSESNGSVLHRSSRRHNVRGRARAAASLSVSSSSSEIQETTRSETKNSEFVVDWKARRGEDEKSAGREGPIDAEALRLMTAEGIAPGVARKLAAKATAEDVRAAIEVRAVATIRGQQLRNAAGYLVGLVRAAIEKVLAIPAAVLERRRERARQETLEREREQWIWDLKLARWYQAASYGGVEYQRRVSWYDWVRDASADWQEWQRRIAHLNRDPSRPFAEGGAA